MPKLSSYQELLATIRGQITELDIAEAAERLAQGAVLIDVREAHEVSQGTPTSALHISRGTLEAGVESRVEKSADVLVMCASGQRSAFAAHTLQQLGYRVASIKGGLEAWKAQGQPWHEPKSLSEQQRVRYSRHLSLKEIGVDGQQKLLDSNVLCIGAGGLGSPATLYLAAAGVGTIGIVDMDRVDLSNLQRQVIHNSDRIGQPKVESAKQTLQALNPQVQINTYAHRIDETNATELLSGYDLVIDGVDNFDTRYVVDEAAKALGKRVVHASIFRFEGQLTVFDPKNGVSYRDLVPQAPPAHLTPNCSEAGVVGALPGVLGALQALEAIKLLLGVGEPLIGRLLVFDGLEAEFHEYKINPSST